MLKKSLIALVVLAIAMPAVAGQLKIHGNWPCTYVAQDVAVVDVLLNVGYYIHILNQSPFYVDQDTSSSDPYHTYVGCFNSEVDTNFDATISASIAAADGSLAEGSWSVTSIAVNGGAPIVTAAGQNDLEICVKGSKVKIENLVGGSKDNVVAKLTIKAVPTAACEACGD
jgi:hypothetical protein